MNSPSDGGTPSTGIPIDYSYLPELIGHLVGLAHLRAKELCLELMNPFSLTPKQFVALEFISNNQGIPQKDIARHIGTTPAVMVSILDALTAQGYVERVTDAQDRRRSHVQITRQGKGILKEVKRLAFDVEKILFRESGLSKSEWKTLLGLLRRLTRRRPSRRTQARQEA